MVVTGATEQLVMKSIHELELLTVAVSSSEQGREEEEHQDDSEDDPASAPGHLVIINPL